MTRKLAIPKDWSFHVKQVAEHFDKHVRESLPWYDLATGVVVHIARSFIPVDGMVVDVGCSTGNIGRALWPILKARHAKYLGIDSSEEMIEAYRGPEHVAVHDVRTYNYGCQPDLVVAFLVLQFVPVKERQIVIARMCNAVPPGGAVVVFDKMMPRPGYVGTVSYRLTLAAKKEAGASPAEIVDKELSVSGVQRPLRDIELANFTEFFRFGDFAGFVYERL